jgi:hypothetical protein
MGAPPVEKAYGPAAETPALEQMRAAAARAAA